MIEAFLAWFMSLVAFAGALIFFFRRKALAAFSATFFLAILLHVRPVMFLLDLDTPLVEQRYQDFLAYSTLASLSGLAWIVIFTMAFAGFRTPLRSIGVQILPSSPAYPNVTAIKLLAIAMTFLSLISTGYLISRQGSIAQFVFAVKIGKELAGSYWVRQIAILAAVTCLYGILAGAKPTTAPQGRALRQISTAGLLFFGGLILINMGVNYLWGNRMNLALFSFAAGLSIHVYIRPFRARELIVIALVSTALLAGLGLLRRALVQEAAQGTAMPVLKTDIRSVSLSLHFAEFDALMLAFRDTGHQFDFRYGKDFYNGLIGWVPRSIMPDRETFHIGAWFRRVYEPNRINGWPVTVIGDWYINFSILGILIGAMISGAAAALVDGAYRHVRDNPWHAAIAPTLGFFFFYGGVGTATPQQIFVTVLPIAVLAYFARGRSRQGASGGRYRLQASSPFSSSLPARKYE